MARGRRDPELGAMRERMNAAYDQKQTLYQEYIVAKNRCSGAFKIKKAVGDERFSARETLDREYEAMQRSSENYDAIWSEYARIRDSNNPRIESLKREADYEHSQMVDYKSRSQDAYNYGDHDSAGVYSAEGRMHQERLNALNAEISALCREVTEAKEYAEHHAPKTDSSAYKQAKAAHKAIKERHEKLKEVCSIFAQDRDQKKAIFDAAHAEFLRLRSDYLRKRDEVEVRRQSQRQENQHEREKIFDKAGIRQSERENAKIVKKPDGTTQVYHGGLGKGDGLGHGHVALDRDGKKTYDRDTFEEQGKQNYVGDPADSFPGKGQWTDLRFGWIEDHAVTWCEGTGVNAGQTLICDGHVTREYFDACHDHYGPDTKYKSGRRIEDVTESMGRKKYYSGPGK